MNAEVPEWLVVGAPVVVVSVGGMVESARTTRVKKIAKLSFTVEANDERFSIGSQERNTGGVWGVRYRCLSVHSPEGKHAIAAELRRRQERSAARVVEAWLADKSYENRVAAIAALESLAAK